MIEHVKSLYESVARHNIIVFYNGAISNEMVMQLGDILEKKKSLSGKMKRLFSIFLEMSQNLMRYSAHREKLEESETETGVGMVLVAELEDYYLISAANQIESHRLIIVSNQIELVNNCTKEELKAMYLERRKLPPPPGSKGAGLGIIDIARKSDTPIEFQTWPSPQAGFTYFSIMATVQKEHES